MARTVDAVIDETGRVRLLESLNLPSARRAIVTVLDDVVDESTTTEIAEDAAAPSPWRSRYEPVRLLGEGGMSTVFLARDRATAALVGVKELRASVPPAALQQECRALSRLRHPDILALINFDLRGSAPYLVSEYATGTPLSDVLAIAALTQPPVALALITRIFEAVAFAHEHGVIHRDLKPDNVLVAWTGDRLQPKILDFGLAIVDALDHRDAHTGVGMVAGTVRYMAPEQLGGEAVSPACDVYAIGQMAWEMLAGVAAFPARPDAIAAKMSGDGLTLDRTPFRVDPAFADLVRACTRRRPADRPAAREAAGALDRLLPRLPRQANLVAVNLGFDDAPGDRPSGWFDGLGCVDDVSTLYDIRVTIDADSGERCVTLQRATAELYEFGVLMQRVPASHLAGMQVRLDAMLRTSDVTKLGGLWLRADGPAGQLAFRNTHDRPVHGTSPWTTIGVELDLPEGTTWLNVGVLLAGSGRLDIRGVSLRGRAAEARWVALDAGRLVRT